MNNLDHWKSNINYRGIVKEMVEKNSERTSTSLEYHNQWYQIEISVVKI